MTAASFDVVVVGLGAVGAATLLHLAGRGRRVLGLDRWDPPHSQGSSHGDTRLTRCAIGEGEQYIPLVQRSHVLWRELEAETGTELLTQCGALILAPAGSTALAHGKPDFVRRTRQAAERFDIPHEMLAPSEVMRRFPQFRLRGDELAYFEPGAGFVRPERCIAAQLTVARRRGAEVRPHTQVVGLAPDGDGVRLAIADGSTIHAGEVVLAAGAWSPGLLDDAAAPGGLARHMRVVRQVVHWLPDPAAAPPGAYAPERFPPFIWLHGDGLNDMLYGFPRTPEAPGVKLGMEHYGESTADGEQLRRAVDEADWLTFRRDHLTGRLPGLDGPPVQSIVCPYTMTPDGDFLVARPPGQPRVTLVSACSGHGFKHSAGLGEAVAQALDGSDGLAGFGAGRF